MAKKRFSVREVCTSCGGTGLYCGMAEGEGAAVVCSTCKGSGCHVYVHEYKDFVQRTKRKGVKWVYEINPGIGVGQGQGLSFSDFGGMPFEAWWEGAPFSPGSEMRKYTCPAWWYQSADYKKKPNWDECVGCGAFVNCRHFKDKVKCWARFEAEQEKP